MLSNSEPVEGTAKNNAGCCLNDHFLLLPIPVPPAPLLERAVGYQNERSARYMALWWEPCGDEVMVSDGYVSFTGHWPGYLAFIQHRRIYPQLVGLNLGSSEENADYHLVIDLVERKAYVAPNRDADQLLSSQWQTGQRPALPALHSLADLEALLTTFMEMHSFSITEEELIQRMEEDRKAVQELANWLNDQPA
jgi:hypothetical protein